MGAAEDGGRGRLIEFPDPPALIRRTINGLDTADRLVALGAACGIIGAALSFGLGAGFIFASAVFLGSAFLHIWAEVR